MHTLEGEGKDRERDRERDRQTDEWTLGGGGGGQGGGVRSAQITNVIFDRHRLCSETEMFDQTELYYQV